MAHTDLQRWDDKWTERTARPLPQPDRLLLRYQQQLSGGSALDIACGLGQNALWLAEQGYHVTGVDISPVALIKARAEAQARQLAVDFIAIDLDNYSLPENAFDLIAVFHFLDRRLFQPIQTALRPGGWLFYKTFNIRRLQSRPTMQAQFALEIGELERTFAGLETVEAADQDELSYIVCKRK